MIFVWTALVSKNVLIVTRILALNAPEDATMLAVPTKSGVTTVLIIEMLLVGAKTAMKATAAIVATPMCMLWNSAITVKHHSVVNAE
mmetsp:Transcript_32233/g.48675  ORF Transcript_32233/g.48675 Transcript_32233/m.48675 type:complete len:87 (-) Transcript_32233:273-533(-)